MSDATEWATIKIHETTRDEAREDPRTYTEIMQDGLGQPTGGDVDVDELIDTIAAEVGGPNVDDSEIAREVARQIDYAELATRVADEVEGRMR